MNINIMLSCHLTDHELEQYYLGMLEAEPELAQVEEHLLCCPECVARAEDTQYWVDAMRVALLQTEESDNVLATG